MGLHEKRSREKGEVVHPLTLEQPSAYHDYKVNPSSHSCNYKKERHWKIRVFSLFTVPLVSSWRHHLTTQTWHLNTINLPQCWNYFWLPLRGIPIATEVIPSVVQVQWTPKSSPSLTSWGSHLSRCCNHLHVLLVCDNYGVPESTLPKNIHLLHGEPETRLLVCWAWGLHTH